MGLFGDVTGAVIMKYKADVTEAKAAVKGLAAEQKRAAREAADAVQKQGEAFEASTMRMAKGLAIAGGAVAVLRTGLKAYKEESRLTAGAAGVDIDRLSASWDGLKTRMELMTLAQAGHRGAWKLTTGQLELVSEGMRALEAQGYESQEVFDQFTETLKKGKLEGLDKFGLSVKATGDQAKDLRILMKALGKEVLEVGGNFASSTDDLDRSMTRFTDAVHTMRSKIGEWTNDVLGFVASASRGLASMFYGDLPEDRGAGGRVDVYAEALRKRRGPGGYRFGRKAGGVEGFADKVSSYLPGPDQDRYLLDTSPTDADYAGARAISSFKGAVRRGLSGSGPLGTATPAEFAAAMKGLPEDWRLVDEELGKQVDDLSARLGWRMATGFPVALAEGLRGSKSPGKAGRGGGGRSKSGPTLVDMLGAYASGIARTGADVYATDQERQRAALGYDLAQGRMAGSGILESTGSATEALTGLLDELQRADNANRSERESWLEKTFGPVEEFEVYADAFTMLSSTASAAWDVMYEAIVNGEELSGKALAKAIGTALGLEAKKLGAEGLAMVIRGGAYSLALDPRGPGMMAGGAAMMAGAVTIGAIAAQIGGGSNNSVSRSAAGVGGGGGPKEQDHRSSERIAFLGDSISDDSPRERARRTRRALNSAQRLGPQPSAVTYG